MFRILWFSLAIVIVAVTAAAAQSRIVNGQRITIDKAPYIVSLRLRSDNMGHICGGTLITPQFVVTAAHCFLEFSKQDYVVVAGASTLTEQGERSFIDKVFVHPKFSEVTGDKDVAVLKLRQALAVGRNVQPIELCELPLNVNDLLQVSGWGKLREGEDEKASEDLYTIRMPIMPQDECVARHRNLATITDSMMCASSAGGVNACTGDSGGPGIQGDQLCAVVSWGDGCGDSPSVFVRISAVRDFIDECLQK